MNRPAHPNPDIPRVSIVIPAYRSDGTIAASLSTMVAQSFPQTEVVVVDSSPDDRTQRIVTTGFPDVRYMRSEGRLLPHGARNRGVEVARGELLVFTDPDVYAPAHWVKTLVDAYDRYGGVIVGSVECHGAAWVHTAMHFCKFDKWLPGGPVRLTDVSPTVNMLCDRRTLQRVGGFDGSQMLGDTLISWQLTRAGVALRLVPEASVEHHHTGTFANLVGERYERGADFGHLRAYDQRWSAIRLCRQVFVSIVPLRLAKLTMRTASAAIQAGNTAQFFRVLPGVVAGHAAWLAGETSSYIRRLVRDGRQ